MIPPPPLHFSLTSLRVWVKQRIRSPLFERLFRQISILCVTSRWGEEGVLCYTLAERYGERIRCFTLAPSLMRYFNFCPVTFFPLNHDTFCTIWKRKWNWNSKILIWRLLCKDWEQTQVAYQDKSGNSICSDMFGRRKIYSIYFWAFLSLEKGARKVVIHFIKLYSQDFKSILNI